MTRDDPLVPPSRPPQSPPSAPSGGAPQPYPVPTTSQGWGQPAYGPPMGWAAAPTDSEAAKALRSARTALGWAIGAAVGAALALVVATVSVVSSADSDEFYEPLRGQLVGVSDGSSVGGDRLEYTIGLLLDEYGVAHDLDCPDTPAVSVSSVIACHGEVDGYEWTGVVVFEDDSGAFVVLET